MCKDSLFVILLLKPFILRIFCKLKVMSRKKASSKKLIPNIEDVVKLILLVQERPVLYNFNLKDYHNKDVVEKVWEEVAAKMNATPVDCKMKWQTLRNAYARHHREEKKYVSSSSSLSISKKKKWYLANILAFLKDFMGHQRKVNSSHQSDNSQDSLNEMEAGSVTDPDEPENMEDVNKDNDIDQDSETETINDTDTEDSYEQNEDRETLPKNCNDGTLKLHSRKLTRKKEQGPLRKPAETVVGPMIEILKATALLPRQDESETDLHFFKSILPDLKKLHPRQQREFKEAIMKKLNELLNELDGESPSVSSSPVSIALNQQSPSPKIHVPQSPSPKIHAPQSPSPNVYVPQSPPANVYVPQSPSPNIYVPQSSSCFSNNECQTLQEPQYTIQYSCLSNDAHSSQPQYPYLSNDVYSVQSQYHYLPGDVYSSQQNQNFSGSVYLIQEGDNNTFL